MDKEALDLLYSPRTIKKTVARLASEIDGDHGSGPLTLVSVLKGSFIFPADLARALRTPAVIEFIRVASYRHRKTAGPLRLRICALLDKPTCREVSLEVDYRGFTVPDTFLVGYGLDFNERYRQLPGIYSLSSTERPPP